MQHCPKCNAQVPIPPEMRERIREFVSKYFYLRQNDLADMLGISQARMSEIINAVEAKRGK